MDTSAVEQARSEIDRINRELTALLVQRMEQVDKVARWKAENHQPVSVPAREEEIITEVRSMAGEKFSADVETVFRALFAASRAREERLVKEEK